MFGRSMTREYQILPLPSIRVWGSMRAMTMSGNPAIKPAATAIRLVAIDLDGTLLDDAKRVGEATGQALRSAAERGVKVVIASARPPRSGAPYLSRTWAGYVADQLQRRADLG